MMKIFDKIIIVIAAISASLVALNWTLLAYAYHTYNAIIKAVTASAIDGNADGPTSIFVSNGFNAFPIALNIFLYASFVISVVVLVYRKILRRRRGV